MSTPSASAVLGASAAVVITIAAVLAFSICLWKKKKKRLRRRGLRTTDRKVSLHALSSTGSESQILPSSKQSSSYCSPYRFEGSVACSFKYEQLAAATCGFAKYNLVGEGAWGCVYRGILQGGRLVAIKEWRGGLIYQNEEDFLAEVEATSRVRHRHLVQLLGYCIEDNRRFFVHDYFSNGSLNHHLHGKSRDILDWPTRVKIASGIARGMMYLHENCQPRVVHGNVKSSNILLDKDFEAHISDFGFVNSIPKKNVCWGMELMADVGYLAPEYVSKGAATEKADVYSFGVVLLEMVTGRKPVDHSQPAGEECLVEWARPLIRQISGEEKLELLADPFLNGVYDFKEMMCMLEVAAACIQQSTLRRPRMGLVLRALEENSADTLLLDLDCKPAHGHDRYSSFTSLEIDSSTEIKRFCQHEASESQDCSSEYSGAASDYSGAASD